MIANKSYIGCSHFKFCSGCLLNESVDAPPILHEVGEFFDFHGFSGLKVVAGLARGWRCRAKLAVRGTIKRPLVGLFEENSHKVLNIPSCQVHHPSINRAADLIRSWVRQERIEPYVEASGSGELRYIQLVAQRTTGRIQLALVVNTATLDVSIKELWGERLQRLMDTAPDLWHSLWINTNTRRDNVIFGETWWRQQGEEWLWETLGSVNIAFAPATFGQANPTLFEELLQELRCLVPINAHIAEFYAGVGVIGMNVVDKAQSALCCEINRHGEACFKAALDRLPAHLAKKIAFHYGQAGEFTDWVDKADVIIVDPPRKGLDEPLLKALTAPHLKAKRLIYVSCGWKSFQRHAETLLTSGWRLSSATAYILFPGTNQVELLVAFDL